MYATCKSHVYSNPPLTLSGLLLSLFQAFLGCMLFGNMAAAYADLGTGWLTGMKMLLGNYDPEGDVGQSVWTICFYWSYMVVAFFLLLNALLAIIVEAYDTVKQDTDEDKIDVLFIFGYENLFVNKYRAGAFQMPLAHLLSILEAAADPVGSLKTAPAAAQSSLAAMVKKLHESTDPVIVYNDTHFFPIPGGSLEHKTTEAFDQGMIEAVLAATLGINEQEANVLGWNMISMFGKNVDANGDGVVSQSRRHASFGRPSASTVVVGETGGGGVDVLENRTPLYSASRHVMRPTSVPPRCPPLIVRSPIARRPFARFHDPPASHHRRATAAPPPRHRRQTNNIRARRCDDVPTRKPRSIQTSSRRSSRRMTTSRSTQAPACTRAARVFSPCSHEPGLPSSRNGNREHDGKRNTALPTTIYAHPPPPTTPLLCSRTCLAIVALALAHRALSYALSRALLSSQSPLRSPRAAGAFASTLRASIIGSVSRENAGTSHRSLPTRPCSDGCGPQRDSFGPTTPQPEEYKFADNQPVLGGYNYVGE